ncbi:hypothetical protein TUM12370_17740 [Salmonella enterica subsp. enterica serovar Choleraesuis]|nr:hypothetical protein TUM12370_17740 [Salmonella enterica subsp. enterica serovar Choleraesuis]
MSQLTEVERQELRDAIRAYIRRRMDEEKSVEGEQPSEKGE